MEKRATCTNTTQEMIQELQTHTVSKYLFYIQRKLICVKIVSFNHKEVKFFYLELNK